MNSSKHFVLDFLNRYSENFFEERSNLYLQMRSEAGCHLEQKGEV